MPIRVSSSFTGPTLKAPIAISASSENGLVPIFAFTETLVPNTVPTKPAATPGSYFTFPIWQPNGAMVRFM